MEASEIYEGLYRYFHNYDYKLLNSFVYDWESDFFAMSKSGYFVEVEVKVSRADYFRDFDKEKHRLFKDLMAGKSHHVYKTEYSDYNTRGERLICSFINPVITFDFGNENTRHPFRKSYNWMHGRKNNVYGYWVNDYGQSRIRYEKKDVYAQATGIELKPIASIQVPHQLYFAVPKGLITKEELPPYAGLLEMSHCLSLVKKAPYMHKRKQDMDKVLLKKFYNLWEYKTHWQKKIEIHKEYKENEQTIQPAVQPTGNTNECI